MKSTDTWQAIRADLAANTAGDGDGFARGFVSLLLSSGFHAALLWRLSHLLFQHGPLGRLGARVVSYLIARLFSVYISPDAQIGAGLTLPHPVGIAIGENARLGDAVTVYQNVTIGQAGKGPPAYPTIGSRSILFAGAVLVGDITLGDDSVVGANAVVLRSFPAHSRVAGVPARALGKVDSNETTGTQD
jgi:serine O-acetyltransferase